MSDKLRDAAERLRCLYRGDPPGSVYGHPPERTETFEDCALADLQAVADGFLAEHPGDDDEMLNEEWLRSVWPPENHRDGISHRKLFFWSGDGDTDIYVEFYNSHVLVAVWRPAKSLVISQCTTRGKFRKLLSALKIKLKEPGDAT